MKRFASQLVQLITILALVWLPIQSAHAALVQCDPAQLGGCNLCDLLATIQTIVNFLIEMGFVILTIVVAYAGFQLYMSQGNPGAFSKAMGTIWNGVIGMAIVLAAWVIINTILTFFAHGSVLFWNQISC